MALDKETLLKVAGRLICVHKGRGTCSKEGDGCTACGANDPINIVLDAHNLGQGKDV